MVQRWTKEEENLYRKELQDLYILKNLSIREIAPLLNIKEQSVFDRLKRLGIETQPSKKLGFRRIRHDINIPKKYSPELAELFGVLLGDGHISHFQMIVTLGNKEASYVDYVKELIHKIFGVLPKVAVRNNYTSKKYYNDVYIGSVSITKWLFSEGFVTNKVKYQADVPKWIHTKKSYTTSCIRGIFDTDGSVYKIRFGTQISFTNRSIPILRALQKMLKKLKYKPSSISSYKIYLTREEDVCRFFQEIRPANQKHIERYKNFNIASVG